MEAELFALCSLHFACCLLIFARCSLLFACFLLLFASCSLFFRSLHVVKVYNKPRRNTRKTILISVLVASAKIPECEGSIQLLWATARLLFTRVSFIYLVNEFFIFSLLVLLKEMRARVSPRIPVVVFLFGVNKKNLEVGESLILLCKLCSRKLLFRPFSSCNKLLDRVAFRLLSNIHDGARLRKQPTTLTR